MAAHSADLVPSHLKPSDFVLRNATPDNVEKLRITLDYIQAHDLAGTAILKAAWIDGVQIALNNFEESEFGDLTGEDRWVPEEHTVYWNPDSALQVVDSSGHVVGVQSPAIGLVHESAHAVDPESISHLQEAVPGYRNLGEYEAVAFEQMSSENLGEVTRINHKGVDLQVFNPTLHTEANADGTATWKQVNEYGQSEQGPQYDFTKVSRNQEGDPGFGPRFGSTEGANPPGSGGVPDPNGAPDDTSSRNDGQHNGGVDLPGSGGGSADSSGGDQPGDPGSVGTGDNDDPDHQSNNSGQDSGDGDAGEDDGGQVGSGIDNGPSKDGSGPEGGRNRDSHDADLHSKPGGSNSLTIHHQPPDAYSLSPHELGQSSSAQPPPSAFDHVPPAAHDVVVVGVHAVVDQVGGLY